MASTLLLTSLLFPIGCGTLSNQEGKPEPYGGVVTVYRAATFKDAPHGPSLGPLYFLDMPLTLVGDTLFLPMDLMSQRTQPERRKRGTGDVGAYIVSKAISWGSTPCTNGLFFVSEDWHFVENRDSVSIRMPSDRCDALEQFLQQSFGPPQRESSSFAGERFVSFSVNSRGSSIALRCAREETHLMIWNVPYFRAQEHKGR